MDKGSGQFAVHYGVLVHKGIIFRDSNGFGVSYRFVGMIMMVPHGPGLKQNFSSLCICIHGAPICFLASLFMLSLINAAFD